MKKSIGLIVFFVFASISSAQTAGVSFMIASPQGEFKNNVDNPGFGVQVEGTLWAPSVERPVSIGVNIGYLVYGHVNERRAWPGFPGIFLNLSRTNSIANLHALFKINPFMGSVRPYVEGIFGGNYLFTTSEVKSENDDQQIASSTNYDDFTWSYGGGAGILFKLADNLDRVTGLFLDLKVRYMYGTEAEYLTENSVFVNSQGDTIINPQKSKTDLITFHIGVVAYFN
ncbi:MAG: hypothetical protein NTX65_07620 [Ignavibacteriales bacterium]|nr:hypothetical protein [Ignavibacteriales bacterium]